MRGLTEAGIGRELDDLREFLALATEWQLATLEGLPKRTSKCERDRQKSIADQMVLACKRFAASPKGDHGCGRLRQLLSMEKA